jgi:heme exporter protein B
MAIGTDAPLLEQVGTGIFWAIVMLFGVLISIRQTTGETRAQRDQLALTGIDAAAIYVGRSAASFILLVIFEIVLGLVTIVLYDVPVDGWWLVPILIVIVAAGLSLLGTLAASIVSTGRNAAALVPLLVAPLSIPLLIGATQALEVLGIGGSSLAWVLMMIVSTLVLAVAGVLSARPLQEIG